MRKQIYSFVGIIWIAYLSYLEAHAVLFVWHLVR